MRRSGRLLADHRRRQQQVVVVHPHRSAERGDVGDRRGESAVDDAVRVPPRAVQLDPSQPAVEQRPQDGVGEPLVVALDVFRGQRNRVKTQVTMVERLRRRPASGPAHPTHCVPAAVTDDSADAKPPGLGLSCPSALTSTGSRLAATTSPFISTGLSTTSLKPVPWYPIVYPSETGHRSPMFASWPNRVRRGVHKMVIAVDVDGTLYDGVECGSGGSRRPCSRAHADGHTLVIVTEALGGARPRRADDPRP